MTTLVPRKALMALVSLSIGLIYTTNYAEAGSPKNPHNQSGAIVKANRNVKRATPVLLASRIKRIEANAKTQTGQRTNTALAQTVSPATSSAPASNSGAGEQSQREMDTALQSLLRDLAKALRESDEASKIENQSEKAALSAALSMLDKAISTNGTSNRIVAHEHKEKLNNTVSAQTWESGELPLVDGGRGSMNVLWARKVNGLINITIAGNTTAKFDDGPRPIEFVVVINGKSTLDNGFDIQSQSNVHFWLGKLTNFSIDAGMAGTTQAHTNAPILHALVMNRSRGNSAVCASSTMIRPEAADSIKKSDSTGSFQAIGASLPKTSIGTAGSVGAAPVAADPIRPTATPATSIAAAPVAVAPIRTAPPDASITAAPVAVAPIRTAPPDTSTAAEPVAVAPIRTAPPDTAVASAPIAVAPIRTAPPDTSITAAPAADVQLQASSGDTATAKREETAKEEKNSDQNPAAESTSKLNDDSTEKSSNTDEGKQPTAGESSEAKASKTAVAETTATPVLPPDATGGATANLPPYEPAKEDKLAETASLPTTTATTQTAQLASVPTGSLIAALPPMHDTNTSRPRNGSQGNVAVKAPSAGATVLIPDRALAGENITVAVISAKDQKPEPYVSLSFNGTVLTTGSDGRVVYQIPEESPPGPSLQVIIDGKANAKPSAVHVHQPLLKSATPQMPSVDKVKSIGTAGGIMTIEGHNFNGQAEMNHVILDAKQEAKILVASPVQIKIALPANLPPGHHSFTVTSNGMTSSASQCETVAVQVQPLGKPERASKWMVKIVGTQSKVKVKLSNDSPDLVKLVKGNEQTLLTPGGSNNLVVLNAQRIARGPLRLTTTVESPQ